MCVSKKTAEFECMFPVGGTVGPDSEVWLCWRRCTKGGLEVQKTWGIPISLPLLPTCKFRSEHVAVLATMTLFYQLGL